MSQYAIEVDNITKSFKINYDRGHHLKDLFVRHEKSRSEIHQVLKGISFKVPVGQSLGLVGVNGCGKSTTLKMLTRILEPDSGSIKINGRVSSLLELGAGFHPDMSGRENIYINASIFGLKRAEIDKRLQDIIDFSELGEFIDNPVRTYSSGMYMRLAFSVAINVDADILLMDEVLAVGDLNFQRKCLRKLNNIKKGGATIVLVSHDTATIADFCDRAIWIKDGLAEADGPAEEVAQAYMDYMDSLNPEEEEERSYAKLFQDQKVPDAPEEIDPSRYNPPKTMDPNQNHFGLGDVLITKVRLLRTPVSEKGNPAYVPQESLHFAPGDGMRVEYDYVRVNRKNTEYAFGVGFNAMDSSVIMGHNTKEEGTTIADIGDKGTIAFNIHSLPLAKGEYMLNVSVIDDVYTPVDFYRCYLTFIVEDPADHGIGTTWVNREWYLNGEPIK
ncbi:MAG: ABC transporter ATP-binding protein [Lachnospiraceae bacterium]|nr:ABC transporter ATP-binding protein [Lachnospiraceae bacterium]